VSVSGVGLKVWDSYTPRWLISDKEKVIQRHAFDVFILSGNGRKRKGKGLLEVYLGEELHVALSRPAGRDV
jgi:hypothetical protein